MNRILKALDPELQAVRAQVKAAGQTDLRRVSWKRLADGILSWYQIYRDGHLTFEDLLALRGRLEEYGVSFSLDELAERLRRMEDQR